MADPDRRAACEKDFRRFCGVYFPAAFTLEWSGDHLKVIAEIEAAILRGGQFAQAMPRGSGKTTLAEVACIWAILYAHRRFVCLIGATADRARAMLESIKTEFECNEALLEDFPPSIYPISRLERIHNRAGGQTLDGEPTRILWTADKVVMPTVALSPASGAILVVTGLEGGNIRGQKHKLADGHIVRPDLVIIDDPQTTESAWSESQSARREALLAGDVLGMAGPGKQLSALITCTKMYEGDLADTILDREKSPEWDSECTRLVYAFPANEKLWEEYTEIRRTQGKAAATAFYCERQPKMDEGARIGWPARIDTKSGEITAGEQVLQDDGSGHLCQDEEPRGLVDYNTGCVRFTFDDPVPEDEPITADYTADRTRLTASESCFTALHAGKCITVTGVGTFRILAVPAVDEAEVAGNAATGGATFSVSAAGTALDAAFWATLQNALLTLAPKFVDSYTYPDGFEGESGIPLFDLPTWRAAAGLDSGFPRCVPTLSPLDGVYDAETDTTAITFTGEGWFVAGHVGARINIHGVGTFVIASVEDGTNATVSGNAACVGRKFSVLPQDWADQADPAFGYTVAASGDVLGPWLLADLQAGLKVLRWTTSSFYPEDPCFVGWTADSEESWLVATGYSPTSYAQARLAARPTGQQVRLKCAKIRRRPRAVPTGMGMPIRPGRPLPGRDVHPLDQCTPSRRTWTTSPRPHRQGISGTLPRSGGRTEFQRTDAVRPPPLRE